VDDIPPLCGFFFCERAGARLCIAIECHAPRHGADAVNYSASREGDAARSARYAFLAK